MKFGLDKAQELLRDSVARFCGTELPVERVRDLLEDPAGHRAVYRELAEQGTIGLLIDEAQEGAGLGLLEAAVVAQELGRGITPVSYHSAGAVAPLLIGAAGSPSQRDHWLGAIAEGTALVTSTLGATSDLASSAGKISGSALYVADAVQADAIVVLLDEGAVVVPSSTDGLRTEQLPTIDQTRNLGRIWCDDLEIAEEWKLPGFAAPQAERALQAGQVLLAADSLGACYRALAMAVDYALERKQFDRVIGSFQSVKHLCSEMIAGIDPLQSLLWYTAHCWDRGSEECSSLVPLLKAHAAEVGADVSSKATQVFGGMGFTWECDMHLYYKRIAYDRQVLGGPEELRRAAFAASDVSVELAI